MGECGQIASTGKDPKRNHSLPWCLTQSFACLTLPSDVRETEVELEQPVPNLGSSGEQVTVPL